MAPIQSLPEAIELYRDRAWRRDAENRVEGWPSAERFIEQSGFCSAMTDCRRPGPSLYIAVCGRRDAHMPRNVQKDLESRLTWTIKDEVIGRGRVYYAKLARGRATFVAPRLVQHYNALWGVSKNRESLVLSQEARAILRVLRHEWEMASRDLRQASGIADRVPFNKAMDELQRTFKVVPSEVIYEPNFTYIWSLAEARFQKELAQKVNREEALRELARAYLQGSGMTLPGELGRVTGLSRVDAGLGNWALVDEGFAVRIAPGVYSLAELT